MKIVVSRHVQAALMAAASLFFVHAAFAQSATRTRLKASLSPSSVGQTVRLTAEVDMTGSGVITGNMEFRDGGSTLGVAPLSTTAASMSAVSVGALHACAINTGSGVRCWGYNDHGELGDGSTVYRNTFVDVAGLDWGAATVVAGDFHSCALLFDRTVRCWGWNGYGQLGDGSTTNRLTPVVVPGLTGVVAIAAGRYHTCAVLATGQARCWGSNDYGEVGDGTTTIRLTPVDVQGVTDAVAVVVGNYHTCVLSWGGGAQCWGVNNFGQLGDGSNAQRLAPTAVVGLSSGVLALSAGYYFTCALLTGGGVKCWGDNSIGQLGDGTLVNRNAPVDVSGLTGGMAAIAAGRTAACALASSGAITSSIKCWGNNDYGKLGDRTTTLRTAPVRARGLTQQPVAIAMGDTSTCTLNADRRARCWGLNNVGQLGDGTFTSRLTSALSVKGLWTVVRATAAFETNALARGVHPLEAVHAGDAQNLGSTGKRFHSVR